MQSWPVYTVRGNNQKTILAVSLANLGLYHERIWLKEEFVSLQGETEYNTESRNLGCRIRKKLIYFRLRQDMIPKKGFK